MTQAQVVDLSGLTHEQKVDYWFAQLKDGKLIVGNSSHAPVILEKDEELQFNLFNVKFSEPRSVNRGAYASPGIRITRRIHLHFGGWQSESHQALREKDRGVLVVTNKRIIFSGEKHADEIDLRKVLAVEACDNGVVIKRRDRDKAQYFTGVNQTEMVMVVDGKRELMRLSGAVLACLIEGLIK